MQSNTQNGGFIALFAQHRVAANLLMLLMILAGAGGVMKLNTQFFPSFEIDIVTVQIVWSGAAAEDVERSVVLPVEDELSSVNGIDTVYATASQSMGRFRLELEDGADTAYILDEVKQKIDGIRSNLPSDIEEPVVQQIIRYESIANLLLTAPGSSVDELRPLARKFERELLDSGVRKIDFSGMPEEEIAIQIPAQQLHQLGMTFSDISTVINQRSLDLPAGTAAKGDGSRQIRGLNQQRDAEGFSQLPLLAEEDGRLLRLGDVAMVEQRARDGQVYLTYKGQPAVVLRLRRTEADDTLSAAKLLNDWYYKTLPTLPEGVELKLYNEDYEPIQERIDLLLKNGLGGLVLVVAILFLFLNARVAFWVTVGIPVSFLATLAVLYGIGGSINMISLFGLIMALGIIVDDAIVVGEDTLAHVQRGEPGLVAAQGGALRMLAPVTASSLTTIAAFLPLLIIEGRIGNILGDIPIVVVCVIVASLIECFLILPGHLHHSLKHRDDIQPSPIRRKLDAGFERFRDHYFRRLVTTAITYRGVTITLAIALFVIAVGMLQGGRIKFTFFPAVERETLTANVQFTAGTGTDRVADFLIHLEKTLDQADKQLGGGMVKIAIAQHRTANFSRSSGNSSSGDEVGSLYVELTPIESRTLSNQDLIKQWRQYIVVPAGIEAFSIDVSRAGPSGKPIEVKLTGQDSTTLKQAADEIAHQLRSYSGLSNVADDLPYGKSQLIYSLTPSGSAAGLKIQNVGRQLRAAFDGLTVQKFYQGQDEIEVVLILPDHERNRLSMLENYPVVLPDGSTTPLSNVIEFRAQRGLESLQRVDGQLAINVSADLDESSANANEVIAAITSSTEFNQILGRYGVTASFEGKNKMQQETLSDMKLGLMLALALVYIILAWVFASYSWPMAVMLAIPMGLTGAVFGHLLMGLDLTILSLFGLFGLSGIVINDSIVLIEFYKKMRHAGLDVKDAIVEAACQRLRAVLLTSLTTIAGLTPILFEPSLQAQFLIPMAAAIVFGLAYGTVLILLVIPSILTLLESAKRRIGLRSHIPVQQDMR